jgi:N-acetylglucosaminyldiphosphoundecaprenol N-acetyl-beta-D-mannosaminyltransferase
VKELSSHDRFDILDCKISAANFKNAIGAVDRQLKSASGGYVCFANVHTVVTSKKNIPLRDSTNHSFLSLPDGKPLSVYAKFKGYVDVEQVAGPDFLPFCINAFPDAKHYFYGSTQLTLDKLKENLLIKFPSMSIVGMCSPPFRELSDSEIETIQKDITAAKPDFIWVGLGAPKQEVWMRENFSSLKPAILFGVGAAFDFHAGLLDRSPKWMQNAGLEWFYRLIREPRRLWKRYLITNTSFIYYLILEKLAGVKKD